MNEDIVLKKLTEHDQQFENIKDEVRSFRHEILAKQDEVLTILRRLDEERIFTAEWIKRIEKEVEAHREEITKIKQILKVN